MLPEIYTNVVRSGDSSELLQKAVAFARWLGFETVTVSVVADSPRGVTQFFSVENPPPGYVEMHDDPAMWARDPVLQHLRYSSLPIAWNRETYLEAGQSWKWERQAEYGYSCGLAYAMHLPNGRHFFVGVDRSDALPSSPAEVARMLGSLQLFAVHAEGVASKLLMRHVEPPIPSALTERELEALRWTMEGKTAWEVAAILGISEQTASRHLYNATQKLGCANKHHAVARALRLRLVE